VSGGNLLFEFGPFALDPVKRILKNQGELVPLHSKALDLLLVLVEQSGRIVEKDELMKRLWPDSFVEEGNLSVQVSALRKALGETPNDHRYILTIPGRGYRFAEPIRRVETGRDLLVPRDHSGRERSGLYRKIGLASTLLLAAGIVAWLKFFAVAHKAPALRIIPFTSFSGEEIHPTFSPDGSHLAYAWNGEKGDNFDVHVQLIGAGGPLQLTRHPDPDFSPTWSPDGRHIAFIRQSERGGGIFLIPALGGHERKVATIHVTGVAGPYLAWSPDGKSLVVVDKSLANEPCSLFLLSIDTGELKRLTFPNQKLGEDRMPAVSPDGKTVAFSRGVDCGANDIYLVPSTGGQPRRLTFDSRPIHGLAWNANGQEIIFSSERAGGVSMLWRIGIDLGKPELLAGLGENVGFPSISRQQNRLTYTHWVSDANIWRLELDTVHGSGRAVKLIASTRNDESPQYSRDGKRILFASDRSGGYEFWVCDSEGHNTYPLASDSRAGAASWSPDGQQIAFDSPDEGKSHIYVMSAEGGVPRRLTVDSSDHVMPSWSHDGQWIYFGSNRSGDLQVWKIPSAGGQTVQVTKGGGLAALESRDGKFLYYSKGQSPGLWRVPVAGGEEALVIASFKEELSGYWGVADKGIYFVDDHAEKLVSSAPAYLKFMSFGTGRIREIMPLEKPPMSGAGLSVSPDGRWVLYQGGDQRSDDIMLVENFH
jgi:Tol biopolymer transport system component/DNA-binding winged helix-turn-helix (wHTH) protein